MEKIDTLESKQILQEYREKNLSDEQWEDQQLVEQSKEKSIYMQVEKLCKDKLSFSEAIATLQRDVTEENLQVYAIVTFIGAWQSTHNNFKDVDAVQWLKNLPPGELKQEVISEYLTSMWDGDDFKARLQLIGEITDKEKQESTLNEILEFWLKYDRSAATQWIQQSTLPQKIKDQFLKAE